MRFFVNPGFPPPEVLPLPYSRHIQDPESSNDLPEATRRPTEVGSNPGLDSGSALCTHYTVSRSPCLIPHV